MQSGPFQTMLHLLAPNPPKTPVKQLRHPFAATLESSVTGMLESCLWGQTTLSCCHWTIWSGTMWIWHQVGGTYPETVQLVMACLKSPYPCRHALLQISSLFSALPYVDICTFTCHSSVGSSSTCSSRGHWPRGLTEGKPQESLL